MLLHVLTSDEIVARPDFPMMAEELAQAIGPRLVLHLRSRHLTGRQYTALARRLAAAVRHAGGRLVVNERVDVAMVVEADGVQLGRGALVVADVHRLIPGLQIGVSVHTVEEAREVTDNGAPPITWLIAGPIFPTASHPGDPGRGVKFLREVIRTTPLPVVAIGGILPQHVAPLVQAGAAGVAVIGGIWGENDPPRAAMSYLWEYDERGSPEGDDPHRERERARRS